MNFPTTFTESPIAVPTVYVPPLDNQLEWTKWKWVRIGWYLNPVLKFNISPQKCSGPQQQSRCSVLSGANCCNWKYIIASPRKMIGSKGLGSNGHQLWCFPVFWGVVVGFLRAIFREVDSFYPCPSMWISTLAAGGRGPTGPTALRRSKRPWRRCSRPRWWTLRWSCGLTCPRCWSSWASATFSLEVPKTIGLVGIFNHPKLGNYI